MLKVNISDYDARNKDYTKSIGASRLKQTLWFIFSPILIQNSFIPFSGFRKWVLCMFGASIGMAPIIRPGVRIKYPWKLSMGDHVWLGEDCWIDNLTDVKIGSHVCISQGAMLCTGNHNYHSSEFELIMKPIILEYGAWIGARGLICPGVTAHSHSMLTAGSVATNDMDAFGIYQGNPAVRVKSRTINS